MKILELHYSTSWAGAERFVIDISNELSYNNEIILCIIEDDINPQKSFYKKDISNRIKYINLHCKSGLSLQSIWRVFALIKKEKPDIVHTHTDALAIFLPALFLNKRRYFQTLHSVANEYIAKKKLKFLYRYFYSKLIQPITISPTCLKSYEKFYKLTNAICINNGRVPLTSTPQFNTTKEYIESLKLHKDDKVFIHVGRYDKVKNQRLLIQSFDHFLSNQHHGILLLIGAGYECKECEDLLIRCHKGIYRIGVQNNICDYLLCSDFFLLSSIFEGLPISLLEALSCGVIPICTPAGGIPDVINNKALGIVTEDFTESSYYKAILEGYQQENNFNRNELKKYFNNNFSISKCAQQYIHTFKTRNKK